MWSKVLFCQGMFCILNHLACEKKQTLASYIRRWTNSVVELVTLESKTSIIIKHLFLNVICHNVFPDRWFVMKMARKVMDLCTLRHRRQRGEQSKQWTACSWMIAKCKCRGFMHSSLLVHQNTPQTRVSVDVFKTSNNFQLNKWLRKYMWNK